MRLGRPTDYGRAALQGYDSGLVAYSAGPPSIPGIVTAKGGATHYCIAGNDAGNFAHVVGPGGQVVSSETSDYCATWTAS